jgi:hypothetical protein
VLTLFTVPKPFVGPVAVQQENALSSWRALAPSVQVIVFGAEPGAAEAASATGALHVPEIARSERGTPLVNDLFRRAQELAANETLCFVNADIILPPAFAEAVAIALARLHGAIAVGQCRNVDVGFRVDGWTAEFEAEAVGAPLRGPGGIDYIVFPRGAFSTFPPFRLGRANFDNWLLWDARRRGRPVVDLTQMVPAVHQSHEYEHVEGGRAEAYFGAEARHNYDLAGGRLHLFNIDDSTHRLTARGVRRNLLAPLRTTPPLRWLVLAAGRMARLARGRRLDAV